MAHVNQDRSQLILVSCVGRLCVCGQWCVVVCPASECKICLARGPDQAYNCRASFPHYAIATTYLRAYPRKRLSGMLGILPKIDGTHPEASMPGMPAKSMSSIIGSLMILVRPLQPGALQPGALQPGTL